MAEFYLESSNVTGPIPSEIGQMTGLSHLGLDNNSITGALPSEIILLTNLRQLGLVGNELSGTIPTDIGSLVVGSFVPLVFGSLVLCHLQGNHLSGIVPDELCSMGRAFDDTDFGLTFDCNSRICGCDSCPCQFESSGHEVHNGDGDIVLYGPGA